MNDVVLYAYCAGRHICAIAGVSAARLNGTQVQGPLVWYIF